MNAAEAIYTGHNPFSSVEAMRHSGYSASVGGELVRLLDTGRPSSEAEFAHLTLRAAMLHPDFPCVGAKSAIRRDALRTAHYARLADPAVSAGLARDLYTFVQEYRETGHPFTTFVATFAHSDATSEETFERDLWQQLRLLRELDANYHDWDPAVARDPHDSEFAFSFGGVAFFVVGMHNMSGRWARRLPFSALAFNPRAQFDRLRADGDFTRMQQVIRRADERLQGSINPMLDSIEPVSEARQYSGRAVSPDWRCPFAGEDL